MRLASIIDVSLVDVPRIPVTVIFTGGCNFDCPYCQNASLIPLTSGTETPISKIVTQVKDFLSDGFCITGGEPTLQRDLPELLRALKEEIGGHINLNTQGSNPSVLEESIQYLDSVWFDLKSAPQRYRDVCRTKEDPWPRVHKSINLIMNSDTEFWPRSTFVGGLIDSSDINEILSFLKSIGFEGEYVIQNYVGSSGVRASESKAFSSPTLEEMEELHIEGYDGIEIRLDWR
ncbi:MAG: anaerobic ribonucleoside-triphosphate reductase activating protein [Candidatus Thorarchaeota archaeon]